MKKKILTFIISICLFFCTSLSLLGCKETKIGEQDWLNQLGYFSNCPSYTVYEYQTRKAFTYVYPRGSLETVLNDGNYLATVYVSNEFEGFSIDDSKLISMDYAYTYEIEEQKKTKLTPINGTWNNYDKYGNVISTIEKEQVEFDEPCNFYPWLINFARNNYAFFDKGYEDNNIITYYLKEEHFKTITEKCKEVYGEVNVMGLGLTFEKDVYSNSGYNDSSDLYRLDKIFVRDQNNLLFTMGNIGATILEGEFDLTMKDLVEKSNFTLKGGEGVDYGEYYFTENAIKIYTPNNPDESQREGYLIIDRENDSAKFISKNAQGSFEVQDISVGAFENRKQDLIKAYLNGIINGFGSFKHYLDDKNNSSHPVWVANGIKTQLIGYDITYNNVKIAFANTSRDISNITFDYVINAGESSITHNFKLTNFGSTTVNVPKI